MANSGGSASFLSLPIGGSVGWGSDHGVDGTGRVLGYVEGVFSLNFTLVEGHAGSAAPRRLP
ncbi:MAG: hypothetical protein QM742_18135 [Aquabacterium sp.]